MQKSNRRNVSKAKKGTLPRLLKTMFAFYPVMLPLTIVCIVISAAVSAIPSIFMQNVIAVIEQSWQSGDWSGVGGKKKKAIDRATSALARKLVRRCGKVKPGLKTRAWFFIMHLIQRKGFNPKDAEYWKEKGWTADRRPWR